MTFNETIRRIKRDGEHLEAVADLIKDLYIPELEQVIGMAIERIKERAEEDGRHEALN